METDIGSTKTLKQFKVSALRTVIEKLETTVWAEHEDYVLDEVAAYRKRRWEEIVGTPTYERYQVLMKKAFG